MHETVDETIDRVAGEMTAVVADPTLTARVRERLHPGRPPWVMPALAVASLVGIVAVAVVSMTPSDDTVLPREGAELSAADIAPLVALARSVEGSGMASDLDETTVAVRGTDSGRVRQESEIPDAAVPAMVADADPPGAPAPLAIAELSVSPLTWPGTAEIAALEVAPLEVLELDLTEEPKEPK